MAELSSEPDIASQSPKYQKQKLPNGTEAWAMSSSKYVQEAVKNVKIWLAKRSLPLDAPRHCRHHIAQSWIYRQNWTRTMQTITNRSLANAGPLNSVVLIYNRSVYAVISPCPRRTPCWCSAIFAYLEKTMPDGFDPTYPVVDTCNSTGKISW
jgi:hypothetical protein